MPWGAAIGAGISLLGDELKSDKNGGAGTKNSSSEPWAMAQPFLMQNLAQGQALQSEYAARPMSARQNAAYDNAYALSDYGRQLVPSLLGQMGSQPVGFDKRNPTARPKAWDWNALAEGLGQRRISDVQEPAPAAGPAPKFVQSRGYTPEQERYMSMGLTPWAGGQTNQPGGGSYGAYNYGDTPEPGTQAYRDQMEYFLMGGNDPYGLAPAGLGIKSKAVMNPWLLGGGGNSGDSVGGSAAADGSGGGGPGAF